jgi:hypothetical protein
MERVAGSEPVTPASARCPVYPRYHSRPTFLLLFKPDNDLQIKAIFRFPGSLFPSSVDKRIAQCRVFKICWILIEKRCGVKSIDILHGMKSEDSRPDETLDMLCSWTSPIHWPRLKISPSDPVDHRLRLSFRFVRCLFGLASLFTWRERITSAGIMDASAGISFTPSTPPVDKPHADFKEQWSKHNKRRS